MYIESVIFKMSIESEWERGTLITNEYNDLEGTILNEEYKPVKPFFYTKEYNGLTLNIPINSEEIREDLYEARLRNFLK